MSPSGSENNPKDRGLEREGDCGGGGGDKEEKEERTGRGCKLSLSRN